MRQPALLLFLFLAMASRAVAQPTNMDVFQALALQCMAFVSEAEQALIIDASTHMPYVRSAIVDQLNKKGQAAYLVDSVYTNKPANLVTLRYNIDGAAVDYKRLKKKKAKRTVSFFATASLISAQGMLLQDKVCREQAVDTVSISDLASLESSSYAETKALPLKAGFAKRVFQPVILIAATTLTVYLFFTLRSESSSDEN